jgi:hypothetical protein
MSKMPEFGVLTQSRALFGSDFLSVTNFYTHSAPRLQTGHAAVYYDGPSLLVPP